MKIGYSLLLGEYIKAEQIDYLDCKNFQIVCPECKEPVFKAVRDTPQEIINYLSHYEKDKAYTQECELRVSKIDSTTFTNTNRDSHNQKLKYFLRVLKEALVQNEFQSNEIPKIFITPFAQIKRSKSILVFREMIFNFSRKHLQYWDESIINETLEFYINEIKCLSGEFYKTSFSLEIQKRIAKDIWQHLLTPTAKENYVFLFNYCYFFFITRLEEAAKIRILFEWETLLHQYLIEMMHTSKDKGLKILNSLADYTMPEDYDGDADSLFDKLATEITYEMLGTLLRLPYYEIIKKYNLNFNSPSLNS